MILTTISNIKTGSPINIDFIFDGAKYRLRPIRNGEQSNADIEMFTTTRNNESHWASSKFTATNEKTINWIKNIILPNPSTILFIIENDNKDIIGHIGLQNVTNTTAEIGYVMRSDKTAPKGIMSIATNKLITWAARNGISHFTARVWADNIKSMNLFIRTGFTISNYKDMWKHHTDKNNNYEWLDHKPSHLPSNHNLEHRLEMELSLTWN